MMLFRFCCLALLSLPLLLRAENVSRTPPELYAQTIQPLLTPLEPLLAQKPMEASRETGGEIVLYERVVQLQEDGRRLAASHWVSRAVTEAGTTALERDVNTFHRRRQKVSLAVAHTIAPDGKRLPVRDDAAFLQTPQRSADDSLYDDHAEAVVVFPDVKQGSATELVLVEEDITPRIPGQFTGIAAVSALWPAALLRQVLELPRAMADRLSITTLGGVPEVRREEVEGGARVRFTWEVRQVPAEPREQGRPTITQTGPCIFLTTLRSWEEFMQWYWPQVEPNLVVSDTLRAKVDEWTKDAKSRGEIIAALLRRASDDVRYVGLEFADGDLVPRPVNTTWENQYGDCKDKSCLLAAMLAAKGIRAHPALINTDFPGRVERRSPDFRHFDHCIVAVEQEGGGWMFCDPTIPGLLPGMIGAADGERDVLLVKNGVEWARTPAHDYGTMRYRIEAEMDAAGGVSGWIHIEADGQNAAYQAYRESKDTREELLDRMRNFLSGFAESIRVVDVKKHAPPAPGESWRMDVYFLVPGAGGQSLTFPADSNYVPNTGNRRERESLWPFWRERVETTARLKLPPGLAPEKLPPAYKASSRYADAEAAWEWKDGAAEARFLLVTKESAVTPADWPAFADQMNGFRAWLDQPLPLRQGDAPAPTAPADELTGFALMPSVDGQIALVEEKYPSEGNTRLRRAALEKAITLFPGDKDMLLRAGWRLATLDINEDRPADALRRIESFLESCRSAAPAEEAGAADYMRALALARLRRWDEATDLWRKLTDDAALSGFRRTWAHWQIARVLIAKDGSERASIIATLEKGMALHSENEEVLYPFWVTLQLGGDGRGKVEAAFKTLTADRPADAPRILNHVLEYTSDLTPEKHLVLLEILRGLGKPEDLGERFASLLRQAEASLAMSGIAGKLRERAAAEIKAHAKAFAGIELPAAAKTAADFLKAAKELNDKSTHPSRATRFAFEALARSGDGDNVADLVWECCSFAEWWSRAAPDAKTRAVLESAFALGEMLPPANGNGQECRLLQATVLHREDKLDVARAKLEALAAARMEDYPSTNIAALQLLARIAETEARWDDAMKFHTQLMEQTPEATAVAAWHAACISILREQWDEAFTWIERLRATPEKARGAAAFHDQMQRLLDLAAHRDEALAWWKSGTVWWARWSKEVQKAAPKKRVQHPRVAEIPGVEELGELLGQAMLARDTPGGMDHMHTLASAARVHPYYMFEFAALAAPNNEVPQLKPLSPWCRSTARAAYPFFPSHDAPLLRQWLVASAAVDLHEKDYKSMDRSARRFQTIAHKEDEFTARMAVVWLAAVADGRLPADEAIAAGHSALASRETPEELRPNLVFLLAHTLRQNKMQAEAKALLDKELASLPAEHPLVLLLKTQRKQLDAAVPSDKLPALPPGVPPEVFVKWMTQNKPAWFDYADPQSLDDPRIKDVKQALRLNGPFSREEQIKAAWLLAKAGRFPAEDDQYALRGCMKRIIVFAGSDAAKHRAINSVMSLSDCPVEARADILEYAGSAAVTYGDQRLLKPWLQLPPAKSPPEDWQEEFRALRIASDVDVNSIASLKDAGEALDLKEHSGPAAKTMGFIVRRLFALGETAAAKALMERLEKSDDSSMIYTDSERKMLETFFRDAEPLRACHEALREVVMEAFPECAAMEEPVEALRKAGGLGADDLLREDAATARQLFLWAVKQRQIQHDWLQFWSSQSLHGHQLPAELRRRMAETVVRTVPSEHFTAETLMVSWGKFEQDDAEERRMAEAVIAPLRAQKDPLPAVSEALRYADLSVALATGTECDPPAVLGTLKSPALHSMALGKSLGAACARRDKNLAGKLLEKLPAEPRPSLLAAILHARRFAGDEEKTRETAAAARTEARKLFTTGWATRDPVDLHIAVSLVEALGEPDLIPAGLLADAERWLRNDHALTGLRVRLAILRKDWSAAAEHAARGFQEYPRSHEFKFHHGLACHHLGRKEEARTSLTAFLAIVHSEPECAAARQMLQEFSR
jgi:transglutaminase-like putative cysteine protease